MSDWIAKALVRHHGWLLCFAIVSAAASWPLSTQLRLDWKVEAMFPAGDPLVASYHKLQQRFGGNQVVLAVYRDRLLWDESGDGLDRLSEVSRRLAEVDGVSAVLSLAELHTILETLRGPLQLLNLGGARPPPLLDSEDELAQAFSDVFAGYTHQPDSQYVAIACLLDPNASAGGGEGGTQHTETIVALRAVMDDLPAPASEGLVTGEPVLVADGFEMVQRDGYRLGVTSTVLVVIVLLVCFRSIRWTLIPIAVVHWSLLMTQTVLVLLDFNLTMISSTLTAIVTVIGVATSTHLLLRFQQVRRGGRSRADSLRESYRILLVPIFWACVTDAIGFSALMSASVGPVRDFGLMMAVGSLMVLVAIILVVPGLALIGRYDTDPSTPRLDMWVRWGLRKVLDFMLAHRRIGLIVLVALATYGIWGSLRMSVETDFTKNFRSGSPIVQGYAVVERELGGAGVWDIMLPAPRRMDAEYLAQVQSLEQELRALEITIDDRDAGAESKRSLSLTKVLSIADADLASQAGPLLAALPATARLEGMRRAMPEFTAALLSQEIDEQGFRWLRIMLRSSERAPADAKQALVNAVRDTIAKFTSSERWRAQFVQPPPPPEVAGYHVMLGALVSSVLADQWQCFLLASCGIFLVMTIATRSLRLAFAAMVPNALPVLLVLGTMGWSGRPVNMGAAMIAAVSLGLSVDSSIHYLMHYQRRLGEGARPKRALQSAQENVGLAVVLATVALIAGFASLAQSEFVPTVVFGTLASLTMLGGLFGNLVLLPLLVETGGREAPQNRK